MSNIYVIILAGGIGSRTGQGIPKQFLNVNGKPVIIHTLNKFLQLSLKIEGIIIAVPEEHVKYTNELIKEFADSKLMRVIKGGKTRQGSSYNAITCTEFNDNDILVFHDAARPFVSKESIETCIKEAEINGAAGLYIKATDTVALIEDDFVKQIPDRNKLYYTQTPQVFKYKIIREAHELALSKGIKDPTDDVQLVLDAGYKVKLAEGSSANIKITNAFDVELAEFISGRKK